MEQEIRESMKDDIIYSPKLRLNEQASNDIIPGIVINKQYKYDQSLIIKAIQNGMIMNILYQGEDDDSPNGHERTICPLVIGVNRNTKNILIRGYHLEGFSVKEGGNTEKIWRLFNARNIKSITFTGNFLRMPPKGYMRNDRIMTERTIQRADFNEIRRNQNKLAQLGKIESQEEAQINTKLTIASISVKNLNTQIDLKNPWSNPILSKFKKNSSQIKISVLKSIIGNEYIFLIGAIGTINRSVKIYENNVLKGTYKTIQAFTGDQFNKYKSINNISTFPMYEFVGKKS